MTTVERPARAVLLFHGGIWTDNNRAEWEAMTGSREETAKALCDLALEVLAGEQARSRE
jgi:hypothetical protein